MCGRPNLGQGSFELERLKDDAWSLQAPMRQTRSCDDRSFAVIENVLSRDGNTGRNDFISGRPGRLNGMFSIRPRNSNSSG